MTDYPQAASDEAKRALKHKEENGSSCGTSVGWNRARQLANREALSEQDVKDIHSFLSRAKVYDQTKFTDENGKEINVVDRWGTVNKQLSAVATDVFTYFEPIPVPNPANMISAFAIADAIKVVAVHWIQEKYGGTINQDGDVVL